MDDLIERLRAFEGSDALGNGDFAVCYEAAARIAALEADNARLIEALTPFAKSGDLLVQAGDRGDFWAYRPAGGDEYGITGKHLLAARATLAKIKETPDA